MSAVSPDLMGNWYIKGSPVWYQAPPGNQNVGSGYYCGFEFDNIAILKGATINSAILHFPVADFPGSGSSHGQLYGEGADSGTNPISGLDPSTVAHTTAHVAFPHATSAVDLDVKSIVQELVNRSGWASGNTINFVGDAGGTDISGWLNSNLGFTLAITYTGGTSGNTGGFFALL